MKFTKSLYRYEKKFLMESNFNNSEDFFKSYFGFYLKTLFPERIVNSIYYDTENFKLACDTEEGNSNRTKIRIRYYGESKSIINPKLD